MDNLSVMVGKITAEIDILIDIIRVTGIVSIITFEDFDGNKSYIPVKTRLKELKSSVFDVLTAVGTTTDKEEKLKLINFELQRYKADIMEFLKIKNKTVFPKRA